MEPELTFNLPDFHNDFKHFVNTMFPSAPTEKDILAKIESRARADPGKSIRFRLGKAKTKVDLNIAFVFRSGFVDDNFFIGYRGVALA